MPPKKSAPAKKSAHKKAAHHHDENHHADKDLRRAFEHSGRVSVMQKLLPVKSEYVATLVRLGHEEVVGGDAKNAADLLRAAEHFSFAAAAGQGHHSPQASATLGAALRREFDHLEGKAEEHWDPKESHGTVAAIYDDALNRGREALDGEAYHEALELIRGAEALAHVKWRKGSKKHPPKKLGSGRLALAASS